MYKVTRYSGEYWVKESSVNLLKKGCIILQLAFSSYLQVLEQEKLKYRITIFK